MPLNITPRRDEKESDFISRCIKYVSEADPNRPNKQVQAICYDKWARAKGQKTGEVLSKMGKMAFFDEKAVGFLPGRGGVGLYKKQVLRFGTWRHPEDPEIEFDITPEVAKQIVENFNNGVPDESPVVLMHTQDPRMKVGTVKWFDYDDSGIYAILSVSDKEMQKKIDDEETMPGVSVWLDLDYHDKETGESLGAVIKHVALVNNPYIEKLYGFEQVDFSEDKGYMPLLLSESKKFIGGKQIMSAKNKDKDGLDKKLTKEAAIAFLKETENIDVEALLADKEELLGLHKKIDDGELINKGDAETLLSDELITKMKEEMKLSDGEFKEKGVTGVIKEVISNHTELSEKVKTLTEQLSSMEADKRVDAMLSEGYALPSEKDVLTKLYLSDKKLFDSMEEARRKGSPLIQFGEKGVKTKEELDVEQEKKKEVEDMVARNIKAAEEEGYIIKKN